MPARRVFPFSYQALPAVRVAGKTLAGKRFWLFPVCSPDDMRLSACHYLLFNISYLQEVIHSLSPQGVAPDCGKRVKKKIKKFFFADPRFLALAERV
ncbi:MAG: hypothetical protein KDJ74_03595 [Notoacmeibacter sp.]|nr:hypothetical protein [Notoacmeibacter sp.]